VTAQQLDLGLGAPVASVRRHDPRTAKTAAAKDPKGRARQRRLILEEMVKHGPRTADELAVVLRRHRSVASTRLTVLGDAGHAEKCGTRPCPDEFGKWREVEQWRITEAGREWLTQ